MDNHSFQSKIFEPLGHVNFTLTGYPTVNLHSKDLFLIITKYIILYKSCTLIIMFSLSICDKGSILADKFSYCLA